MTLRADAAISKTFTVEEKLLQQRDLLRELRLVLLLEHYKPEVLGSVRPVCPHCEKRITNHTAFHFDEKWIHTYACWRKKEES